MKNLFKRKNVVLAADGVTEIKVKRQKDNSPIFSAVVATILIIYLITLGFGIWWALVTSLRMPYEFQMQQVVFIPEFSEGWFDNYIYAVMQGYRVQRTVFPWDYIYIESMIPNTILYTIGSTLAITSSCCVTAYCSVQFSRFRISKVYTTLVYVVIALPIVGAEAASLQMYMNVGFYDNLFGMILGKTSFLNTYYLIFHEAFKAVPKDFAEAAYIDGAGNLNLFVRLMLPFVSKTFLTVALIFFITYWNEYQVPLLYMPNYPTLAYGLQVYKGSSANTAPPRLFAGCMVLFIPIFTFFCVFHKRLLGNLMLGGVKE